MICQWLEDSQGCWHPECRPDDEPEWFEDAQPVNWNCCHFCGKSILTTVFDEESPNGQEEA